MHRPPGFEFFRTIQSQLNPILQEVLSFLSKLKLFKKIFLILICDIGPINCKQKIHI